MYLSAAFPGGGIDSSGTVSLDGSCSSALLTRSWVDDAGRVASSNVSGSTAAAAREPAWDASTALTGATDTALGCAGDPCAGGFAIADCGVDGFVVTVEDRTDRGAAGFAFRAVAAGLMIDELTFAEDAAGRCSTDLADSSGF